MARLVSLGGIVCTASRYCIINTRFAAGSRDARMSASIDSVSGVDVGWMV
jgi:hypothetical protein